VIQLTRARREKGLNKTRLGQLSTVHPAMIGQIECQRLVPYPKTLRRIAEALGWEGDPEDLLKEVNG
jgi:transcriptional regulator with XRE-family HTH domain